MDINETDATPSNDGQQPQSTLGDVVDWSQVISYRGRTPPDHDDGWTILSISRRGCRARSAETTVNSPPGETVVLGDPHWYVTSKRDRFPNANSPTTEYEHYVVPDTSALAAWFSDDAEIL